MNERTTEVLEQYELEVQSKRRGRGAWICETSQGLKLLREYKGTVKRLEFEEQIMNVLQNQKTCRTDQYMRNREGELLSVAEDGTRCVVKEWFSGRECSVQSEAEVVRAVGQIAKLHRTLRGIAIDESWNLGSILTRPAVAEMERHNRELVRTRNYIRKKRRKSDFERAVSGSFAIFYEQAQEAAGGLKVQIEQDGEPENYLCHGDLNQHHILLAEENEMAVIEFNRMHRGVQVEDLYHFTRKILEKHGWDLRLGMRLLETYDCILPLNAQERTYLYYLFLYPEKYWKQLNFYYNAGKAWIPVRSIEKLQKLEEQQTARNLFLEAIR